MMVRVVKDIRLIQAIVEESDKWSFSKDRDFEAERRENPLSFDYQSVHYILKSGKKNHYDGSGIPESVCCELQIRTLLQHAYSELTHDTIYKPATKASPDVSRAISKSMALIETTDSIFEDVDNTISRASELFSAFLEQLAEMYVKMIGPLTNFDQKANTFILETYSDLLESISAAGLSDFFNQKPFLVDKIKMRAEHRFLYRQPIILLLYKLAHSNQHMMKQIWPFQQEQILPVYSDLGISI